MCLHSTACRFLPRRTLHRFWRASFHRLAVIFTCTVLLKCGESTERSSLAVENSKPPATAPSPPSSPPVEASVPTGETEMVDALSSDAVEKTVPPATAGGTEMVDALRSDTLLIERYGHLPLVVSGTDTAGLIKRVDRAVRNAPPGAKRRRLATLRVRIDYSLYRTRSLSEEEVSTFIRMLDSVERGDDPFHDPGGLRGYYAANDDSCQPYDVSLPADIDLRAARRYPLVVSLHHHGWTDWYRPFQTHASALAGAIVIAPHGRGSCDYMWIAEDDVLSVMDAALADYPVDSLRVYVTGWSMGGTGSFHLPGRYPHRFAASFPKAGNADFTAWEKAWKEDRRRTITPRYSQRMFLRWATAPVTYAENFLHVALAIDHGTSDSTNPVGHSRSMAGRLRQLGYPHVRFRGGPGGHGWGASTEERFEWMKPYKINPFPKRVRFKTDSYRHGTAYWLTIERFRARMAMAEMDVRVVAEDRVEVVKAENVERFRLRLKHLGLATDRSVRIVFIPDKQAVELPRPFPASARLARTPAGRWRLVTTREPPARNVWPPKKHLGLEGPIEDAVREPFLVVIGTIAEDPFARWIVRAEAERWRRQWRRRYQVIPPAKDDVNVTAADIERRSLICFGGPKHNAVVRRVNRRLPAYIKGDVVIVGEKQYEGSGLGIKLIYPNPENPDRTVVIYGAPSWRGMWQISHRFGTWFDWMPLDNRQWFDFCVFDDRTRSFETFLEVGFFDEDWQLTNAIRYGPIVEMRDRTPPRNYPHLSALPTGDDPVQLSDLWPAQIDTAREPMRINRSLNGRQLSIGHRPQRFGLGQWIESAVSYNILAKFRRFQVNVGIDAEGQKTISTARQSAERVHFLVLGDGKVLEEKRGIRFGDPTHRFDVDVSGVRRLTLMVLRGTPEGWLYGPIAWGEPLLVR